MAIVGLDPKGVTRLDGAGGKKYVWHPMFEPKVFRKQICCWRKHLRHYWDFSAPLAVVPLIH